MKFDKYVVIAMICLALAGSMLIVSAMESREVEKVSDDWVPQSECATGYRYKMSDYCVGEEVSKND